MKRLALAAACAAAFAASALPAFGNGSSGTINATISVAAPCITVGPSTTVAFPSVPFNSMSTTEDISFVNCSTVKTRVHVMGTDAVGPTATWELIEGLPTACGHDAYRLFMRHGNNESRYYTTQVTKLNAPFRDLESFAVMFDPGVANTTYSQLYMPCAGSNGGGEEMAFQIVLTASL